MEAKLVVVGGKANMGEVKLRLPMTIGRGRKADLIISHPTVSRIHCELYEVDGALIVRDNGSSNGTFIDDKQIKEAVVEPGKILKIGPLTFRAEYEWAGNAPSLDALAEGRALAATQTMTADELFGDEEPPSVATSPPSKPFETKPSKPAAAKAKPTAAPAKSQPAATPGKSEKRAEAATQSPAVAPPAKQSAAPPGATNDDFDFMADIEFVDDGAQAEPVRGSHDTVEEAAATPGGGADLVDEFDLDLPLETPSPVEPHEPSAETVAAVPEPDELPIEPGFDFLAELDAPVAEEPAANVDSPEAPAAEAPVVSEPKIEEPELEEPAASLPPSPEPSVPEVASSEEPAFDFLGDLDLEAPSEPPAAELDAPPPTAAAPSVEPEAAWEPAPEPEPVAELEPEPEPELPPVAAADLDVTTAFRFEAEAEVERQPAAPDFDFLDAPESVESEPATPQPVVSEPIAETPPSDDEALFDMFADEPAPAAPAVAEHETPVESESPWNIDLPAESAVDTTQAFVPPTSPDAEDSAPSPVDDEALPPAAAAEPTVDFRHGDDEAVGEPAFAFGPPVDETPTSEPESIETESAFAVGESSTAAAFTAPTAKSPRPAPAKKPSIFDKLKQLFAAAGRKSKSPKTKPAAKPTMAATEAPAAAAAGPFVPMFSPSPVADDPIPLADDLFSASAETAAPAEVDIAAESPSPAEYAFDSFTTEPTAEATEPAGAAPSAEAEPEPFDFEAGLFEQSATPPEAEALEPSPEVAAEPAPEIADEGAIDVAPAAATNGEFDFGELFDEAPAESVETAPSPEPSWSANELEPKSDEAAIESEPAAAAAAPQAADEADLDLTAFFDESAESAPSAESESPANEAVAAADTPAVDSEEHIAGLFDEAAAAEAPPPTADEPIDALFAGEMVTSATADAPELEMPAASAALESAEIAPLPAVTTTRRSPLVDVDARLSSSHRMVARVTVRAPRVDVPHMEPEAPAGRNFERAGRTSATQVAAREPVAEASPPVAPGEAASDIPPADTPSLESTSDESGDAFAFFDSEADDVATSPASIDAPHEADLAFDAPVETNAELETELKETVPPAEDVAATSKQQADDDLDKFLDDLGMG